MRLVLLAIGLAAAVAGCTSYGGGKNGDSYPRHERWWR